MVVMQRNAEVPANQVGDPLGGPQFVGPTVGLGSAEQLFEFLLLLERQARRRAAMRFGGEAVRFFCE